jgi:hypothetical protein
MLIRISLLLCFVCVIVLAGCSKSEPTNEANANSNANKPATASTPATTTPATASAGDKIGVPECDEYLTAYDACVSGKVPEVARAQYKTAIEQARASYRKAAENPQAKAMLATQCKQAAEQTKAALKSFNCTF